jgi:hypothetical protein
MSSVLEKKSFEPDRPYSRKELEEKRKRIFRNMNIGNVLIEHSDCGHFYYAKANGQKEHAAKELVAQKPDQRAENVGNCSVCWKINRTPKSLKNRANNLVEAYTNSCPIWNPHKYGYTYYDFDLESDFYVWLYHEFNPKKKQENNT